MTDQNQNRDLGSQTGSGLAQLDKTKNKKMGITIILFGLLVLVVISAPRLIKMFSSAEEEQPQQSATETITKKAYQPPIKKEVDEPKKIFTFDDEPKQRKAPLELLGGEQETKQPPKLLIKSLTGGMMNKSGNTAASGVSERSATADRDTDNSQRTVDEAIAQANRYLAQLGGGEKEKASPKDDIFQAPTFKATTVQKNQYNPNLLLEQGTLIPCVLRVKVISNISGQLSCTITENVYSSNGNVVLIDKGSKVNGYYQGGSVQHGSNQLFVVWQEVRTPDHLIIPLNSGSTDELGANGLKGWVDNHFWTRFGSAALLSVILDGNNILLGKLSDTVAKNSQATREASKEIAATILNQMGDIKPTLYKNHGDKIGIFVARDVDFSGVYKLKRKF